MVKNKIVVVDFSGTLIKPIVAEEANLRRYDLARFISSYTI